MGATLVVNQAINQARGSGSSETPMRVREAAVFHGVSPGLSDSRFPISA